MYRTVCLAVAVGVAMADPTEVVSHPFDLNCTGGGEACDRIMTLDINSTSAVDIAALTLNVMQFPADSWNFSLNFACHDGPLKEEVVLCNASYNNPSTGHCLVDDLMWSCPFEAVTWTLELIGTGAESDPRAGLELEGHVFICPSEACIVTPAPITPAPVTPPPPPHSSSSSGWPVFVGVLFAVIIFVSMGGLIFWWQRTKGQTSRYQSSVVDVAGQEMAGEDASILRSLPAGRTN